MLFPKWIQTLQNVFLTPWFSVNSIAIKDVVQKCLFTWATSEIVPLGISHADSYYSWRLFFFFFDVKVICA